MTVEQRPPRAVDDPPVCPYCGGRMVRHPSRYTPGTYWWGCASWPDCNAIASEHPNGALLSTPADPALRRLRSEAHRLAGLVWGEWETLDGAGRDTMYRWLEVNSESGHIGHMREAEVAGHMREAEVAEVIEKLRELAGESGQTG